MAVSGALRHSLIKRARASAKSGKRFRELPLTFRIDDGLLVEGIVDLAWATTAWKSPVFCAYPSSGFSRHLTISALVCGNRRDPVG
jgi:hypothetical protein